MKINKKIHFCYLKNTLKFNKSIHNKHFLVKNLAVLVKIYILLNLDNLTFRRVNKLKWFREYLLFGLHNDYR